MSLRGLRPKQSPGLIWIASLALAMTFFLTACPKKPPKKPERPKVSVPTRPAPAPSLPESLRPRREASQRIVQSGREYLDKGEIEKAVQTFQEAVNVDPENGLAYFYLAFGLFQTESYDDALGLLDRAQALLSPFPEWEEEVERLREAILESKGRTKGEGREGYY